MPTSASLLSEQRVWQPIETAPKGGTAVDLWVSTPHTLPSGRRVTDARWLDGKWREWIEYDDEFDGELDGDPDAQKWFDHVGWTAAIETDACRATHWMYPPAPPESGK